jgi:hypothetical protein
MDVRGEGRDEDTPAAHRDDLAERLPHEALRARHPGTLRVRRVAEQQVDTEVSDRRQLAHVGLEPVDRRVIELPVAGVQDPAGLGLDYDGH